MGSEVTAVGVSIGESLTLRSSRGTSALSATVSVDVSVAQAGGGPFGAAYTLAGGTQTAAGEREQDGLKALATLKQSEQESKDFDKKAAAEQLDLAVKELALLKLLSGAPGASEAVRLAKQIAAAVQDYAGAGGQSATAAAPTAATAAGGAIPLDQQDPFYAVADAALASLRKYLHKTLPPLLSSPDRKTRAEAQQLGEQFDAAAGAVADAEQGAAADSAAAPTSTASGVPAAVNLVA